MGEPITLQQLEQAAGMLVRASEMAPMVRADHNACTQAIQILAAYIQQERAKASEAAKEK